MDKLFRCRWCLLVAGLLLPGAVKAQHLNDPVEIAVRHALGSERVEQLGTTLVIDTVNEIVGDTLLPDIKQRLRRIASSYGDARTGRVGDYIMCKPRAPENYLRRCHMSDNVRVGVRVHRLQEREGGLTITVRTLFFVEDQERRRHWIESYVTEIILGLGPDGNWRVVGRGLRQHALF